MQSFIACDVCGRPLDTGFQCTNDRRHTAPDPVLKSPYLTDAGGWDLVPGLKFDEQPDPRDATIERLKAAITENTCKPGTGFLSSGQCRFCGRRSCADARKLLEELGQ